MHPQSGAGHERETTDLDREIEQLERELREKEQELARMRRRRPAEFVGDFILRGPGDTAVALSTLFGDRDDLIVVHNMGSRCPYCTLWADGFSGVLPHLLDRTSLAVVSPDTPDVQQRFAVSRGWKFPMYSNADSGFAEAMGFTVEHEGRTYYKPGCSTFRRQGDGAIMRIAQVQFGPGDVYCAPWHLFSLLAEGSGDWEPKFRYDG